MKTAKNQITIPENEITLHASKSSGPGGQHVNKVNTRVRLCFDVNASHTLSEQQKLRIKKRLRRRITTDGILTVVCQEYRSQLANRRAAVDRLNELIADALKITPPRKPTKVPISVKRKRLENKRRKGQIKRLRSATDIDS